MATSPSADTRAKQAVAAQRLNAEAAKAVARSDAAKQQVRAAKNVLKRVRKLAKAIKKAAKQARKKAAAAQAAMQTRARKAAARKAAVSTKVRAATPRLTSPKTTSPSQLSKRPQRAASPKRRPVTLPVAAPKATAALKRPAAAKRSASAKRPAAPSSDAVPDAGSPGEDSAALVPTVSSAG